MTEHQQRIKKIFDRLGIAVRRARYARPLDLRDATWSHPLELAYQVQARPVLVKVPVNKLITFGLCAYGLGENSPNPFLQTLRTSHGQAGDGYSGSPLEAYYRRYQPKTAAELLGLPPEPAGIFHQLPPIAAPLPWHPVEPEEQAQTRRQQLAEDNRAHGTRLPAEAGDTFYGPVTPAKGELEYRRLHKTFKSIQTHGFRIDPRGFENITTIALTHGSAWKFMIAGSGQHRAAALAALGYEHIPVQFQTSGTVGGVVRFEDIPCWILVKKDQLTCTQAEIIFKRMVNKKI
jgi:hypothetical protein